MSCEMAVACYGYGTEALKTFGGIRTCVKCARRLEGQVHNWRPLLRPIGDNVVVLPDVHEETGRIILVARGSTRDRKGMRRRDEDYATGVVLAVGPGVPIRKSKYNCAVTYKGREGIGEREKVYAEVGKHIAFRYVYEAAVQEWRDLLVVHDFDILGILESAA